MNSIADIISNKLLPRIDRPGQYIGLETNAVGGERLASLGDGGVRVALAFPDTYAVGISHLGTQVLYRLLNATPGVGCDRSYCPAPDAEAVMRDAGVPLFGWESRAPLRDFDILGFSLAYEVLATNVLTMLDLAGVPLHSTERREGDPLVIAGDAMADAPEPLADFIDLFVVGDGERPLVQLCELVRQARTDGASREETLLLAARTIEGVYVPRFYAPQPDGRVAPTRPDVPAVVRHVHLPRLADSPAVTEPLVPLSEAIHERVVVEVMRGCPNGCRFCQAGYVRLPVRTRNIDDIVSAVRQSLAATGYREVSLLSLSTSDYPNLGELIDRLNAEFGPQHVSVSLPSLRVDAQLRELPRLTGNVRKGGLTIAAEAGSQRLREAIGKNITEADMVAGVQAAYAAGWNRVKVYFMAGLPGETPDDIDAIYHLCRRLSDARKDVDGQRGSISASVSWFVPKPHTPMQWCGMRDAEYFWQVRNRLRDLAQRSPVNVKFHRIERSQLEGVLCRGDRRVGRAIEAAWRAGARLDAWDEHFDDARWQAAFEQVGLDPAEVSQRDFGPDQPLPWSHIACYRDTEFLLTQRAGMMDVLDRP